MSVTMADVLKLQLDHFYSDPAKVAQAFMATGEPGILREAKRRGIDLAPHIAKEYEWMSESMKKLRGK